MEALLFWSCSLSSGIYLFHLLSIFVEFGTSLSFSPDGLPIKNQDKNREFLDMKLQSLFHEEDS